jgi:hypothetical protein
MKRGKAVFNLPGSGPFKISHNFARPITSGQQAKRKNMLIPTGFHLNFRQQTMRITKFVLKDDLIRIQTGYLDLRRSIAEKRRHQRINQHDILQTTLASLISGPGILDIDF